MLNNKCSLNNFYNYYYIYNNNWDLTVKINMVLDSNIPLSRESLLKLKFFINSICFKSYRINILINRSEMVKEGFLLVDYLLNHFNKLEIYKIFLKKNIKLKTIKEFYKLFINNNICLEQNNKLKKKNINYLINQIGLYKSKK